MNKGFIYRAPSPEDYHSQGGVRLGGLVLQADGQWDDWLPLPEAQNKYGLETQGCTAFNTLKCVQALEKRIYGQVRNWSDRFLAKMGGVTPNGADPHTMAEALRKKGCVYETDWPFLERTDEWNEFYADIPFALEADAQAKFKGLYNFGHQYVGTNPLAMMSELRYSPLGVDVYAWRERNGKYIREGASGHWTMVYGFEEGKYWKCLDSYEPYIKRLDWNFGFTMVKRYTLDKRVLGEDLWSKAVRYLRNFYVDLVS